MKCCTELVKSKEEMITKEITKLDNQSANKNRIPINRNW